MKFVFLDWEYWHLAELQVALQDVEVSDCGRFVREFERIFASAGKWDDFLAFVETDGIADELERTRDNLKLIELILGDGHPLLEKIRRNGVADGQGRTGNDIKEVLKKDWKIKVPRPKPQRVKAAILPLYKVFDLKTGGAGFDCEPSGHCWSDEYKTEKLVLRRIDAGTFSIGSSFAESGRGIDEGLHEVTLTKPFYMGVFAVTQHQWRHVCGDSPSRFDGSTLPVECVSYACVRGDDRGVRWPMSKAVDADSFIGKLRKLTGCNGLDLPTEAQWEYVCRAGTTTPFFWGKSRNRRQANFGKQRNAYNATRQVGSYMPNAWGIYDMHGNVYEWCLDWYGPFVENNVKNPVGPRSGEDRVCRGGCWESSSECCRSAYRDHEDPFEKNCHVGFRVCCSAEAIKGDRR